MNDNKKILVSKQELMDVVVALTSVVEEMHIMNEKMNAMNKYYANTMEGGFEQIERLKRIETLLKPKLTNVLELQGGNIHERNKSGHIAAKSTPSKTTTPRRKVAKSIKRKPQTR